MAVEFLSQDPVANLNMLARVRLWQRPMPQLGGRVYGHFPGGELQAMCFVGGNVVLSTADEDAVLAFTSVIGARMLCSSLMGPAQPAAALWERLRGRALSGWGKPREVRLNQPVLVTTTPADQPMDTRVREIVPAELDLYFPAAVAMYEEEVGVSPLDASNGYRRHIYQTIATRWAFGIVEDSRVIFKADIGAAWRDHCQIQGVWLDPALRGKGLSAAAMNAVLRLVLRRYDCVSLYVNDFNTPAMRLYEGLGMQRHGEFATVMY